VKKCPRCGAPATDEGQPSKRQFFGCGSYSYEPDKLADRTDLCVAWADLAAVTAERDALREQVAVLSAARDAAVARAAEAELRLTGVPPASREETRH